MKKILGLLVLSLALFHNTAKAETIEGVEVNRTAQGINFTQSIDMSRYGTASIQAVYSDGTPASHTLTSGVKPSASITVANNSTSLISAQASVTVNVSSVAGVSGDTVKLNGIQFTEGVHWTAITSTSTSASNLKTIIDAHPDFVATVAGATVTVKYVIVGTAGNGLPVTTTDSTWLRISSSAFTSGLNAHTITINGTTITEGTDFVAHSASFTTASNIVTAINANTTLNTQVVASSSAHVVTVLSLYPALGSYNITTSTSGFLTAGFSNGANPDISIADDEFTKASHGLTTGLKVRYNTTSGSAPGGLTTGTTYFAIKLTENTYKLATSSTNAVAGTAINITSLPTTIAAYSMTPLAISLAANTGFYWQGSNDNSNFSNLSISSVTYTAASNTLWDLDDYAYKYLRIVFTGPTNGGIAISARIYGREE